MPRIKKNQFQLGSPKGKNPMKEMSWCISKHTYVSCIPEAIKENGYYRQTNRYALTIRQGQNYRQSEFIYTKDNIQDAIQDTYREIYKRNYGKTTEE
jgi:hypothetical protein